MVALFEWKNITATNWYDFFLKCYLTAYLLPQQLDICINPIWRFLRENLTELFISYAGM